ncbi:hypothetical protein ACLB2K_069036 [Fragaria x ananassa]
MPGRLRCCRHHCPAPEERKKGGTLPPSNGTNPMLPDDCRRSTSSSSSLQSRHARPQSPSHKSKRKLEHWSHAQPRGMARPRPTTALKHTVG